MDTLMPNKRQGWEKENPFVRELFKQVKKKLTGSDEKELTRSDYERLQTKIGISLKTLHRYFGDDKNKICQIGILDLLAVYIGKENFITFVGEEDKKQNSVNPEQTQTNFDIPPPGQTPKAPKVEGNNNVERKKRNIIPLTVIIVTISGLLSFIFFNQNFIEKLGKETEKTENREKTVQGSIPNEKGKQEPGILKEDAEKVNPPERKNIEPAENLTRYLNNNSKSDIAILIVDDNKQYENELSARIAGLYHNQGYSVTYSLFTTDFIQSEYFHELQNASSRVITMLELDSQTKYVAIGEVAYSYRKGTLVDGTFVCTASLAANIISTGEKKLVNSFTCSANGNGVTEKQAKEDVTGKLLSKYSSEYLSIQ